MTDRLFDGAGIERTVLAGLKAFQRKTVDYVFRRMYEDVEPAHRFLVADEVGLGKTLVARGLIARAINHLQAANTKRIDVIYICSNAEIAAQNVRRLNVTSEHGFSLSTRITLLPRHLTHLNQNGLNFISFTPGTSFNMKSRAGKSEERAVIFRLLEHALGQSLDRHGAYEVLRSGQTYNRFRDAVHWTPGVRPGGPSELDVGLADAFKAELERRPDLIARFNRLVDRCEQEDSGRDWWACQVLIADLRQTLARSCVEALEPDLVILDEFQRFRELLGEPDADNPDDIRNLAHHLFRQKDVRVLLLSATPYKMYTVRDEIQDDHYGDFLHTARFLMGEDETQGFAADLRRFRASLLTVGESDERTIIERKNAVEKRLRRYIARTERLAVTSDRSGMLVDCPEIEARLEAGDVRAFAAADRISRHLRAGDVVDYWKSSPYLLNFMGDYKLKRELRNATLDHTVSGDIAAAMENTPLIERDAVEAYRALDPGNARLRGLAEQTVNVDAWRLLWLPPSLPYYRGRGWYTDPGLQRMTKRLIFSSWNMVPDAISVMLSYEAERQMMLSRNASAHNTSDERAKLRGLLSIRRQDGQPAGMSTFGLLYPSIVLAELTDPLAIARDLGALGRELDAQEILGEAILRVRRSLEPITRRAPTSGLEDQRWYWAAPLLLDRNRARSREATVAWLMHSQVLRSPGIAEGTGEDDAGAWVDHVGLAQNLVSNGTRNLHLGRVPADLVESIALLGLGGVGTCALRSLARVVSPITGDTGLVFDPTARDSALRIAWGFRSLFNIPEVMSLLRGSSDQQDEVYWKRVAEEGFHGNLQAVLDEFVHLIPDWLGLAGETSEEICRGVANLIHDTLAIRAATYSPDEILIEDNSPRIVPLHMRVRFALRFGRDVVDDHQYLHRSAAVRSAFNSPFWPFVLTSTSVGQEGLDFHQYCHAVVHWNLPANPVDLEQREGRVHRYKGHAIRKNVAEKHRIEAFRRSGRDPWAEMFAAASKAVRDHKYRDIEPFWVYEGSAKIERHVPMLPLSSEVERLDRLRKSLAAYRLVFGQPRQEDLIAYLQDRVSPDVLEGLVQKLRVDLSPR